MAEKKEEVKPYQTIEVATQVSPAIKDTRNDKVLSPDEVFVEILNKLDEIKRAIV